MRHIFLLCLLLIGCTCQKPKLTRIEKVFFAVPLCVQVGQQLSSTERAEVDKTIAAVFHRIDTIYNCWNPHSEISRLNTAKAYECLLLSEELATFLHEVETLVKQTGGRFDPTIAPLHKLWVEALKQERLPSPEQQALAEQTVGWEHLIFKTERIVYKTHDQTALDLCAVAKGFAVDELVSALADLGYHDLYVEWGGEIKTLGHHPKGRPWRIEILHTAQIESHDQAIATSGDYYQRWTVEGHTYTHIVNPLNHRPLEHTPHSIVSASMITERCMIADAVTTALMLFENRAEALSWFTAHYPHDQAWVTEGNG